jgi:hypothetical protein
MFSVGTCQTTEDTMKIQNSGLRKVFFLGAIGVAALAVVIFAANRGSDGDSLVQPSMGDVAMSEAGSDDFADVDSLLGGNPLSRSSEMAVDGKSGSGGGVSAMPPIVPGTTASRNSAGVVNQAPSPDGSSSLIDDRKIVQTASMRLRVKEVGASFEEVGRVATSAGGFVASSSLSDQGDAQVASVTIRVPSTSYQTVLSDLRSLGVKVVNEDSRSSDVTAEFTDLDARLRNLEATEVQLLSLLGRATTIAEILQVQDRLNNTRSEIEQVKGRIALLTKLTDLATITIHLAPVPAAVGGGDGGRLSEEISQAWDNSIEFLTDVAAGAIHVVVFAWWIPLVGIPALLIGRGWLRSRPRPIEAVD